MTSINGCFLQIAILFDTPMPSMVTASISGSMQVPISATIPFTETIPATISSSAFRRELVVCNARNFCNLISTGIITGIYFGNNYQNFPILYRKRFLQQKTLAFLNK
jgi:hypothetical protein